MLLVVLVVTVSSQAVFSVFEAFQTSLVTGVARIFSLANSAIDRTTSDYFAAPARENLFLHLWSLSVEEQFHQVFPVILFLVLSRSKLRQRTLVIIVGISAISFGTLVLGSREL